MYHRKIRIRLQNNTTHVKYSCEFKNKINSWNDAEIYIKAMLLLLKINISKYSHTLDGLWKSET